MPDMSGLMQPPYLNPTPDNMQAYTDLQKKQLLASLLTQSAQQSAQTPAEWNSMRVVPKRSGLANVATLASALMAGKAQNNLFGAQSQYLQGLMGGGPSASPAAAPQAPPSAPSAVSGIMPGTDSAPGNFSGPSQATAYPAGTPPQASPQVGGGPAASQQRSVLQPQQQQGTAAQNPMLIPGTSPQQSQMLLTMMGPQEYGKVIAGQYTPTDFEKLARAAFPNDPAAQQRLLQANIAKQNNIPLVAGRKGAPMFNAAGQAVAFSPEVPEGSMPNFNGGNFPHSVSGIQGAQQAIADTAESKQRGQAAGTPTIVTGSTGAPIATFPAARGGAQAPKVATPSGAPPLNPPQNNHILSPTEAKANEALAVQASNNFQALNEKGSAAVAGLRNLSEMKNLLQGFNPGKATGALAAMGNVAISLGMDPQQVARMTNVDPGNVEAFEKNTAALASQVVKEFTNRTTQMEFNTFMANNPNPFMTANGLKRVIDFMEKGLTSTIDQQQEAQKFWQANQSRPERFVTDFPAYYNASKAADIKAGKFDSINPSMSTIRTRSDVNAAAAQQGTVKVAPGMDINALKKAHPPGTIFEFPDGSRGKL